MARRNGERREPGLVQRQRASVLSEGADFPLRTSASFLAATAETPKTPGGGGAFGSQPGGV